MKTLIRTERALKELCIAVNADMEAMLRSRAVKASMHAYYNAGSSILNSRDRARVAKLALKINIPVGCDVSQDILEALRSWVAYDEHLNRGEKQ